MNRWCKCHNTDLYITRSNGKWLCEPSNELLLFLKVRGSHGAGGIHQEHYISRVDATIWNEARAASWQNQQNDLCVQRKLRSAWPSAQSDQSLMPRLIWVFGGRTCHFSFDMRRLICSIQFVCDKSGWLYVYVTSNLDANGTKSFRSNSDCERP